MNKTFRFIFATIAFLVAGCAAPMTEVVSTRQSETIDQHLFKEGDQVWVTYQSMVDTVKTKRGFVLHSDDDSVRLDTGRKGVVDLQYRWIHTVHHPVKDRWFVSLSTGTFWVLVPLPHELPEAIRLTGAGVSIRNKGYANPGFEVNFSIGGQGAGFSSWISADMNAQFYSTVSGLYFLVGLGSVLPRPTEEFNLYHGRYYGKYLAFPRFGFGVTNSISKRFNVRAEVYFIGLRIYLERYF